MSEAALTQEPPVRRSVKIPKRFITFSLLTSVIRFSFFYISTLVSRGKRAVTVPTVLLPVVKGKRGANQRP